MPENLSLFNGFIPYFNSGTYSLSVRDWEETKMDHVKHYRIRNLDDGGFYITARRTFHTLPDLVKHYSGKSPWITEGGHYKPLIPTYINTGGWPL